MHIYIATRQNCRAYISPDARNILRHSPYCLVPENTPMVFPSKRKRTYVVVVVSLSFRLRVYTRLLLHLICTYLPNTTPASLAARIIKLNYLSIVPPSHPCQVRQRESLSSTIVLEYFPSYESRTVRSNTITATLAMLSFVGRLMQRKESYAFLCLYLLIF